MRTVSVIYLYLIDFADLLTDQTCSQCGTVQFDQKIEMDPFHFGYTQMERQYGNQDVVLQ